MNAPVCHTMDFEFFVQEHGVKFKYGNILVTIFLGLGGKLNRIEACRMD